MYVLVLLSLFFLRSIYYRDGFKKGKKEAVDSSPKKFFPDHHETFSLFEESNIIYCT